MNLATLICVVWTWPSYPGFIQPIWTISKYSLPLTPFLFPFYLSPHPLPSFHCLSKPLGLPYSPFCLCLLPLVHTSFPPPPPLPSLLSLCTKTNTITSVFHSLTPESSDKDGIRSKVGKGISHFYSKPKICIFSFFIATQHTTPTTLSDCSFFDDYVYIHYTSPRLKHLLTWKLNGPFKCLLWHWSCETQTMNPKFNLFAYWPSN